MQSVRIKPGEDVRGCSDEDLDTSHTVCDSKLKDKVEAITALLPEVNRKREPNLAIKPQKSGADFGSQLQQDGVGNLSASCNNRFEYSLMDDPGVLRAKLSEITTKYVAAEMQNAEEVFSSLTSRRNKLENELKSLTKMDRDLAGRHSNLKCSLDFERSERLKIEARNRTLKLEAQELEKRVATGQTAVDGVGGH